MASRQLVLFLFLVICINILWCGYYFSLSILVYVSLLNVIVAMCFAVYDISFAQTTESVKSSMLSLGLLGYLISFIYAGYSLSIPTLLLVVAGILGLCICVSLLSKFAKRIIPWTIGGVALLWGGFSWFHSGTEQHIQPQNVSLSSGPDSIGGVDSGAGVVSGDVLTGITVIGNTATGIVTPTHTTGVQTISSGAVINTGEKQIAVKKILGNWFSVDRSDRSSVTYAMFLPLLVQKYGLSTKGSFTFTYVTTKNPLYPFYVAAYKVGLVGKSTSPITKITCKQVMVMLGLIEAPALQKGSLNIYETYRNYAQKRGFLRQGCDVKDEIATLKTLP